METIEREKQWWNAKAANEEVDRGDEAINRALRWREIEKHLPGVQTILDIGGATGSYSIPLAERGYSVTHVDFSPVMLQLARDKAQGLTNICFVEANAADLSRFADGTFDLVLNMDGAISFCGSQAPQALSESCRVTGQTLIVTVSHQAQMVPSWLTTSLAATGQFLPAVQMMLDHGTWDQAQYPDNALLANGATQNYFGTFNAFHPDELRSLLECAGLQVLRCGGLGSLARLCEPAIIQQVLNDDGLSATFLEFCAQFDEVILPAGPGTRQRAGLIAVAKRVH